MTTTILFYLFIFIMSIIFTLVVNSMIHHIYNSSNVDKDFITKHQTGRILNFKTKESIIQYGPAFTQ